MLYIIPCLSWPVYFYPGYMFLPINAILTSAICVFKSPVLVPSALFRHVVKHSDDDVPISELTASAKVFILCT